MATKKESEKKHALYLVDPETGRPTLVGPDDVDAKLKAGWKHPEGMKANGDSWNDEASLQGNDAAFAVAEAEAERQAKKPK